MTQVKLKIENMFMRFGRTLYKNRLKTLFIMTILIGGIVGQMPRLVIDTSTEGLLHNDDPKRLELNAFRDQFGQDNIIVIIIRPPEIFDAGFFTRLKALHNDLENELPYVKEVVSLVNARSTRAEGDTLFVEDLLKDWPERQVNLAELKKTVMATPVYLNNIISEDGLYTAIVIETEASIIDSEKTEDVISGFEESQTPNEAIQESRHYFSEEESRKVVAALNRIVDRYRSPDLLFALSGVPVVVDMFNQTVEKDMRFLLVLADAVVLMFLALLFRRFTGIVLPEIIVFSSLFSTLGLMAIFNIPIKSTTVIVPCFIVAVGVADSVHLLAIFYKRIQQGDSKEDAIAYSFGHSGLAIVMTSLTTAAGLLSFSFSQLSAIAEVGIFSALGVVLALIYSLFLLPPLIALMPVKAKKISLEQKRFGPMDRVLLFFADFSTSHPRKIIWGSLVIFLFSAFFVFKLELTHNAIKFFPDSMQVKKDIELLDKVLKGAISIEIVVDTKKENGVHNPGLLNRIETFTKKVESIKTDEVFVGKVFSINDLLKETHQALNGNDPGFYTIPLNRETIAQEFLLFESSGSDDLARIVDSQFSKTRITVKIPWVDNFVMENLIFDIKNIFLDVFSDQISFQITGIAPLLVEATSKALRSMVKSYGIAFLVVSIMMVLLVGSIKFGLISMIPNLFPIFAVMGFMGFADIPMDLNALMIGSIAIGLVVDDTMHFMYNFRKYYDISGDVYAAVRETLLGTGRALLITSLVLSSNFFVMMLATMKSSMVFGFFTGLVILVALLADFVLAPALMVVATRSSDRKVNIS